MLKFKLSNMNTNEYIGSIISKSKYRKLFDSINHILFNTRTEPLISETIKKAIYCATEREVDGLCYSITTYSFTEDSPIPFKIIFDRNSDKVSTDQFIFDDKITTIFILPYNVRLDNFNHEARLFIIYYLYKNIIGMIRTHEKIIYGKSLHKNLIIAPMILTIHTIDSNYSGITAEMFHKLNPDIDIKDIKEIRECDDPIELLDTYMAASIKLKRKP